MKLHNVQLEWATTIKFLGIHFLAGRSLTIDISDCRKKFFFSVNKILNKSKYCNEITRLNMVETYCLPILMYAIESLSVQKCQINQMNVWWNSVYRSIFKFNKWESVKNLILYLGRLNFKSIYDQC